MRCPRCGNETNGNFCDKCGLDLRNPNVKPKKKGSGCFIAIIVVLCIIVCFFVLIAFIGAVSGPNNSGENISESASEENVDLEEKEYVENISDIAGNPSQYKGKYIKFHGIVSSIDESDEIFIYQIYIDLDYNTSVLVEVPKDILNEQISNDDYVNIDAEVKGTYDGKTVMNVSTSWAYLEANSIEKTTYIDSFGKADVTWEFTDKTIDQNGVSVSVSKVEFANDETRVYVTVTNNSNDTFNIHTYSSKAIQDGLQYENTLGYYGYDYPELSTDLLPGASTSGIICFDKLNTSELSVYISGSSDDWDLDFEDYVFNLVQ